MRTLLGIGLLMGLAACAHAPPAAPKLGPGLTEQPRSGCAAAWEGFRAELSAAAENCFSDEGCVAFESCHAVTRGSEVALASSKRRTLEACRDVAQSGVDVECAARPPRCVARRCVRF